MGTLEQRTGPSRLAKLEALRGFAAVYVFAAHFANIFLANPRWCFPLRFSAEAVMLFFLLSGFVIHYSTAAEGALHVGSYAIKRIRRIYPLFVLSLALGYASQCAADRGWASPDFGTLAGNLAMLQDFSEGKPGVWFSTYYNPALWSLSYECWFYAMYVVIQTRVPAARQRYVVAGISLAALATFLVYPNQPGLYLMYFVIWWTGVEMAREYRASGRVTFCGQRVMLSLLTLVSVATLLFAVRRFGFAWQFGLYPIGLWRHFFSAVLLVIIGIAWYRQGFRGFRWLLGGFQVFAPVSYAFYVFHFPVLVIALSSPLGAYRTASFVGALVVVLVLSYLAEVVLQRQINGWTKPLLQRVQGRAGRGV